MFTAEFRVDEAADTVAPDGEIVEVVFNRFIFESRHVKRLEILRNSKCLK